MLAAFFARARADDNESERPRAERPYRISSNLSVSAGKGAVFPAHSGETAKRDSVSNRDERDHARSNARRTREIDTYNGREMMN